MPREICLIETKELPVDRIKCCFPYDIDCNAFFPLPEGSDPALAAVYAGLLDIDVIVDTLTPKLPLTVYKHGAKTGTTAGTLTEIRPLLENYGQKARSSKSKSLDETLTYSLVVRWLSREDPFAEDGDSGALVYAKHENKMVPLGIHYGSKEGTSYSYLLGSWCRELEARLDAQLRFCQSAHCSADQVCSLGF